jgi:hypothetical protein
MSWLSDLFSPKKTELTSDKESWQMDSGKQLASWAQQYLSQYDPAKDYTGQFTAGMAPGEVSGQNWLAQCLNQPATGKNFELAQNEIQKTLTDQYNPWTSPEYAAMKKGANLDLQDAISTARRGQGARGTYFQDTGVREENKLIGKTQNYLDQLLSSMSMQERQNKLNAVPQAMQLEQYAQGAPLAKASAGMTLGSLPRLIEQSDLESKYNDFLRKQTALSGAVGANQGVLSTSMGYGAKSYETSSPFERIMGSVSPMIGAYLGNTSAFGNNNSKSGTTGTSGNTDNAANFDWIGTALKAAQTAAMFA